MNTKLQHTGVLNVIRLAQGQLNPALQRIAAYVLKNPEIVKTQSIKDLAQACEVSESTITRFVRSIDVPSYQQLKIGVAEALSSHPVASAATKEKDAFVYDDIGPADTSGQILKKIVYRNLSTIEDTAARLDLALLDKAAAAIDKCDMLAFFAMGSSTLAADSAVMRFMRVGKRCMFFSDQGVQQISAGTLGRQSVAVAVSNSGRTVAILDSLRQARQAGATTIAITSFADSPITQAADIVLLTTANDASSGSAAYQESMLAKVAQLLVIDVLYSRYAVKQIKQSIQKIKDTNVVIESTRHR
ncbi:MurR/RpiR family transcriptional regulator [Variovorax rhizosphaerae]|uniref:MurR/RpiR family transcriptional regulator n=1 Tax=Variovorax rhizosphaerae TaxID=1836200 RepID=A0ABU8WDM0_9BURK